MTVAPPDPESLLLHDGFVRALARSLVANAHDAEDVAQDSLAAALRTPPAAVRSLRAWLAGIVQHVAATLHRRESRRPEHEHAAARTEATPSVEVILAREALRRQVVDAVVALPEPYRATILLRYFENLPPRVIARRLGIPVETVRTRTRRGLELLRIALAPRHDSRREWLVAMGALGELRAAAPLAAAGSTAWLGKVILMTAKAKAVIAGVILVATAAAWFLWQQPPGPAPAGMTALLGDPQGETANAALAPGGLQREAVAATPPSPMPASVPTGALRIRALWAEDRSPAADVGFRLHLRAAARPALTRRSGATAADGTCGFADLAPGEYSLFPERAAPLSVRIEAGRTRELEYEVPLGTDVVGIVVDRHDAPFAHAEVWIGMFAMSTDEPRLTARCGADGRFALRSIGGGRWIAARAPGFAPSVAHFVPLAQGPRREVKLVLGDPAGGIAGRVFDCDGKLLEDALVVAGPEMVRIKLDDGSSTDIAPPQVRTDHEGRFAFSSLTPGKTPVAVAAVGHATWRAEVDVQAGVTSPLEVKLEPGVTLEGTVRNAKGEAQTDVTITAGELYLLQSSTRSGAGGAFRLDDLEPAFVAVASSKDRGRARAELRGAPGATIRWDPVLDLGTSLTGRVVDDRDQPVAGCMVEAMSFDPRGKGSGGHARTDARGEFAITNCNATSYTVIASVTEFVRTTRQDVDPNQGPLLLRLPPTPALTARITGRIVDEHGRVLEAARVQAQSPRWRSHQTNQLGRGNDAFEIGPLPAGEWQIWVDAPQRPMVFVPTRTLGDGETWDAGTIRVVPPGHVVIDLEPAAGVPGELKLELLDQGWHRYNEPIQIERGRATLPLPPGRFTIGVRTPNYENAQTPFTIVSGETTRVALPLRRTRHATIRVRDTTSPPARTAELVVRDRDARLVHQRTVWLDASGLRAESLGLAPGDFAVEVSSAGRKATGTLRVVESSPDAPSLDLTLR